MRAAREPASPARSSRPSLSPPRSPPPPSFFGRYEQRKATFAAAQQSVRTALDVLSIPADAAWSEKTFMDDGISAIVRTFEDERAQVHLI